MKSINRQPRRLAFLFALIAVNWGSPASAFSLFKHHRPALSMAEAAPNSPIYSTSSGVNSISPTPSAPYLYGDGERHPERSRERADSSLDRLTDQLNFVDKETITSKATVRVAIALNVSRAEICSIDGSNLTDASTGKVLAVLPPKSVWTVTNARSALGQVLVFNAKGANAWDRRAMADADYMSNYRAGLNSPNQQISPALEAAREAAGDFLDRIEPYASHIKPVAYFPAATLQPTYRGYSPASSPVDGDSVPNTPVSIQLSNVLITPSQSIPSQCLPRVQASKQSTVASGLTACNGKLYRGTISIQPAKLNSGQVQGFNIINCLNVEDYLLSVVPSEMPCNWPQEALKAQAIAARSYIYANLDKHSKDGYDVKDSTEDQVYTGIKAESESTNRAVNSTSGIVLKYLNKPICAYFHSTSGGGTETAENVWGRELPYLKAVIDYDDSSPHFSWRRVFTFDQLKGALLTENWPTKGDSALSLSVVDRTPSQRVAHLLIASKTGNKVVTGETARWALKLPSTNFNIVAHGNSYIFAGRGFGHGLGLSQWGARRLADEGYNAAQILTYYYKDVTFGYSTDTPGL